MSSEQINHDRIAELVTAYGGDLERWPAQHRKMVEMLDPTERERVFSEARGLDQLLRTASTDSDNAPPSDDLMARILASASIEPDESRRAEAAVASVNRARKNPNAEVRSQRRPTTRRFQFGEAIAAASLLAASLVVGFFLGSTDLGQMTTVQLGDLAGLSDTFTGLQTTALDDVLQFHDGEDIL